MKAEIGGAQHEIRAVCSEVIDGKLIVINVFFFKSINFFNEYLQCNQHKIHLNDEQLAILFLLRIEQFHAYSA